jgi:hypothetical protein
MNDEQTRAAEALHATLSVFHELNGQELRSVWRIQEDSCTAEFLFRFDRRTLKVIANPNDDSVDLTVVSGEEPQPAAVDVSAQQPWNRFLAKPFGWGWLAINQQGYRDCIMLSFDDPVLPSVSLNVVASSLNIGIVVPVPPPVTP